MKSKPRLVYNSIAHRWECKETLALGYYILGIGNTPMKSWLDYLTCRIRYDTNNREGKNV